jgi:hypothetical protein
MGPDIRYELERFEKFGKVTAQNTLEKLARLESDSRLERDELAVDKIVAVFEFMRGCKDPTYRVGNLSAKIIKDIGITALDAENKVSTSSAYFLKIDPKYEQFLKIYNEIEPVTQCKKDLNRAEGHLSMIQAKIKHLKTPNLFWTLEYHKAERQVENTKENLKRKILKSKL